MQQLYLKIHPTDNIVAALTDLPMGMSLEVDGQIIVLSEKIPAKHKFTTRPFSKDEEMIMYGVIVGKSMQTIPIGSRISTENTEHATLAYGEKTTQKIWQAPPVERWKNRTFNGYHRNNGKVGTMNYWLVIPLVFCENRNIKVIQEAMSEQLGYATDRHFSVDTQTLIEQYKNGADTAKYLTSINSVFYECLFPLYSL